MYKNNFTNYYSNCLIQLYDVAPGFMTNKRSEFEGEKEWKLNDNLLIIQPLHHRANGLEKK